MDLKWGHLHAARSTNARGTTQERGESSPDTIFCKCSPKIKVLIKLFQKFVGSRGKAPGALRRVRNTLSLDKSSRAWVPTIEAPILNRIAAAMLLYNKGNTAQSPPYGLAAHLLASWGSPLALHICAEHECEWDNPRERGIVAAHRSPLC